MRDKAIIVKNLSKKYNKKTYTDTLMSHAKNIFKKKDNNEFWALKNISFEIEKGETVGIIGSNGAGKSTLLKILSRITPPTSGKAIINGLVSSLLEVGTGFHPELTGRENIYLNGSILGMSRKEINSKQDEIIEFSGLEEFIDMPVKHYSSGMYVRLAFSVAIHLESDILFVDEVLSVGDFQFKTKSLQKINEITSKKSKTVIIVSHNLGYLSKLCDRILLLNKGRLELFDKGNKVVSSYLRKYIQVKQSINSIFSIDFSSPIIDNVLHAVSGQPIEIIFNFKESINYAFIIKVIIENNEGQPIAVLNSSFFEDFKSIRKDNNILCKVNKLPLNEGQYYLRIIFRNRLLEINLVEETYALNVSIGNFYSKGIVPSPIYNTLITHSWKMENNIVL